MVWALNPLRIFGWWFASILGWQSHFPALRLPDALFVRSAVIRRSIRLNRGLVFVVNGCVMRRRNV